MGPSGLASPLAPPPPTGQVSLGRGEGEGGGGALAGLQRHLLPDFLPSFLESPCARLLVLPPACSPLRSFLNATLQVAAASGGERTCVSPAPCLCQALLPQTKEIVKPATEMFCAAVEDVLDRVFKIKDPSFSGIAAKKTSVGKPVHEEE